MGGAAFPPGTAGDAAGRAGPARTRDDDVDALAGQLLPDVAAPIVTYCSNPACGNSKALARRLQKLGYTNVRTYLGGIQDWVEAGLSTQGTAATAAA